MPVTVHQGQITQGAAGADTTISGLSGTPKLLILSWTGKTGAAGALDGIVYGIGVASGARQSGLINAWALAAHAQDAGTSHLASTDFRENEVFIAWNTPSRTQVTGRAIVSAWSSSGIDIRWLQSDGTARRLNYWVICGDEVQCKVGVGAKPSEVGEYGIDSQFPVEQTLALPFTPEAMIFGFTPTTQTVDYNGDAGFSLGFAARSQLTTGPNMFRSAAGWSLAGPHSGISQSWTSEQISSDDYALAYPDASSGAWRVVMNVTEFAEHAAELEWYGTDAAPLRYGYVALAGCSVYLSLIQQPNGGATPVAQSVTDMGFRPLGALFVPINHDGTYSSALSTFNGPAARGLFSLGATDGTLNWSTALSAENGIATSDVGTRDSTTRCMTELLTTGTITNIDVDFSITSLDANGLTIGWQTIDTTLRQVLVFAVGPPRPPVLSVIAEIPEDERDGVNDYFAPAWYDVPAVVPKTLFPAPLVNIPITSWGGEIPEDERDGVHEYTHSFERIHLVTTRYRASARGSYRIANAAEYRFYRKQNTPPVLGVDAPFDANATLPHEPADTYADGIWYVGVTYFNGYVESDFLFLIRQDVDSGAGLTAPPSGPTQQRLELRPGGVVRIHALYWPIPDGARAANTWALWYTVDGSAPDPADPADATQAMTFAAGADVLIYDLPAQANGTTVKVLLRTRRSSDSTDSENAAVLTATADALGPTAPKGADTWRGRVPEGL